jgi:hypothetical protein
MAAFTAWRISLEEWRGSVENRLESLEAVVPLILEQLPPATITPTHQNVVKYYVSELNMVTHKPHATISIPRFRFLGIKSFGKKTGARYKAGSVSCSGKPVAGCPAKNKSSFSRSNS